MNDQPSLLTSLFADQVDPLELGQIALETFGAGVYESVKEVIYHRPGEPPALRFLYLGERLQAIKAGPGLADGDIPKIRA
jgi:hypothetical protein